MLTCAYENIRQYYADRASSYTHISPAGWHNMFDNRRRVTSRTLTDGRGTTSVYQATYGAAQ